jgi:hypothetical protein
MYQYEYFSIEEKSFSHEAVAPLMENTKPLEQVKKNDNRKRHRPINGGETGDRWGGLCGKVVSSPSRLLCGTLQGLKLCPGKERTGIIGTNERLRFIFL